MRKFLKWKRGKDGDIGSMRIGGSYGVLGTGLTDYDGTVRLDKGSRQNTYKE